MNTTAKQPWKSHTDSDPSDLDPLITRKWLTRREAIIGWFAAAALVTLWIYKVSERLNDWSVTVTVFGKEISVIPENMTPEQKNALQEVYVLAQKYHPEIINSIEGDDQKKIDKILSTPWILNTDVTYLFWALLNLRRLPVKDQKQILEKLCEAFPDVDFCILAENIEKTYELNPQITIAACHTSHILSIRAKSILEKMGCITIDDILKLSPDALWNYPKTLNEIYDYIIPKLDPKIVPQQWKQNPIQLI